MNVAVPSVVGTPEITPVDELSVRPAGRVPEITYHVAGELLAVSVAEYDVPTVPEGRLVVVIVMVCGGIALMLTVNCFSALSWPVIEALTVNV